MNGACAGDELLFIIVIVIFLLLHRQSIVEEIICSGRRLGLGLALASLLDQLLHPLGLWARRRVVAPLLAGVAPLRSEVPQIAGGAGKGVARVCEWGGVGGGRERTISASPQVGHTH